MFRKLIALLMLLVFSCGFSILAYPVIHKIVSGREMEGQVTAFMEQREAMPTAPTLEEADEPEKEYAALWDEMVAYNQRILEEGQPGLSEPGFYVKPAFFLREYGVEDEVFGVLNIPRINLTMPVYLGASYDHLAFGAAHMSETSLPIGGDSTCTVIAGHRGWNGAAYFRYVPDLQVGDYVGLTNLWETIDYNVVDTQIVDPDDVESIRIQSDRELLILLTCHPYASGGKQRFLVICERTVQNASSTGISSEVFPDG